MRKRVYVAGPISKGHLAENIRQATEAGLKLLKAGFAPLVPHLSCYMESTPDAGCPIPKTLPSNTTHGEWLECGQSLVAGCDLLLRLPGESEGADVEVIEAEFRHIPVYRDVDLLIEEEGGVENDPPPGALGDGRFHRLLEQMARVHAAKSADYGTDGDPFANIRQSAAWGVEPWVGCLIRLGDKVQRLQTYARKRALTNEGVEDSLLDLASYVLIALVLFRESRDDASPPDLDAAGPAR